LDYSFHPRLKCVKYLESSTHISKPTIADSPQTFWTLHITPALHKIETTSGVPGNTHGKSYDQIFEMASIKRKDPNISICGYSSFVNQLAFCGQTKGRDAARRQASIPGWVPCMCSHHLLSRTACAAWKARRIWSAVTAMTFNVIFVDFHASREQRNEQRTKERRLHIYLGESFTVVSVL